jgi:hypothetical protein
LPFKRVQAPERDIANSPSLVEHRIGTNFQQTSEAETQGGVHVTRDAHFGAHKAPGKGFKQQISNLLCPHGSPTARSGFHDPLRAVSPSRGGFVSFSKEDKTLVSNETLWSLRAFLRDLVQQGSPSEKELKDFKTRIQWETTLDMHEKINEIVHAEIEAPIAERYAKSMSKGKKVDGDA